jgi:hypothetical protein
MVWEFHTLLIFYSLSHLYFLLIMFLNILYKILKDKPRYKKNIHRLVVIGSIINKIYGTSVLIVFFKDIIEDIHIRRKILKLLKLETSQSLV